MSDSLALQTVTVTQYVDPIGAFEEMSSRALRRLGAKAEAARLAVNQDAVVLKFATESGEEGHVTASGREIRMNNSPQLMARLADLRVDIAFQCMKERAEDAA